MQETEIVIPQDMLEGLDAAASHKVVSFIAMCRELSEVVRIENEMILRTGSSVGNEGFLRKLDLIAAFEKEAVLTFDTVRRCAADNQWLHLYLISEVGTLRHAFKLNTALHQDDLARRHARLATLQRGIIGQTGQDNGEALCH